MRRLVLWVPLAAFAVFVLLASLYLRSPSDRQVRSQLIGRPLPPFALPAALPGRESVRQASFTAGAPRILNVFASWCVPCIAEAPHLTALARRGLPIDAIAIRDRPQDVAQFLSRWGDPFKGVGLDADSRVQLSLGSSGVPETFVVDGSGIIRYQHIGPIDDSNIGEILAAYEAAR
ncbi:MAG TPA: DsbE family thiol:disulfide interchange protein [Allosphingosinicella sp.]|jgi:cytochrome c biogenesis protein CcmG/thiol:disulfide interchange protein DsbE